MRFAVIVPFLACCRNRDLGLRIRHRQLAVHRRHAVVSWCTCRELIGSNRIRYRALVRISNRSRYGCCNIITSHQTAYTVCRPAVCRSVIYKCIIFRGNRHGLRVDRQRSVDCSDVVVLRHVLSSVHDLVAFRNRVVARCGVRYIRHAACRCRHQFVSAQKFAARYRYDFILMAVSVIGPFLACCRDRDLDFRLLHRQLAVRRCYAVVSCCSCRELIGGYHIRYWALPRESDRSRYYSADCVASYQSAYIVSAVAVSRSVIGEILTLCRYRHSRRLDRQRSVFRRDCVIRSHVLSTVHDLVACLDRVIARRGICYIRHAARCFRYQLVSFEERAARYSYGFVAMRFAVIVPFVAGCCDRDLFRRGRHRQLTVYLLHAVVSWRACRKLIGIYRVRYWALAREGD